ncbi:MAG: hypothetical protein ACRD3E_17380 [Terriglobales bacterium]
MKPANLLYPLLVSAICCASAVSNAQTENGARLSRTATPPAVSRVKTQSGAPSPSPRRAADTAYQFLQFTFKSRWDLNAQTELVATVTTPDGNTAAKCELHGPDSADTLPWLKNTYNTSAPCRLRSRIDATGLRRSKITLQLIRSQTNWFFDEVSVSAYNEGSASQRIFCAHQHGELGTVSAKLSVTITNFPSSCTH